MFPNVLPVNVTELLTLSELVVPELTLKYPESISQSTSNGLFSSHDCVAGLFSSQLPG